VGWTGADVGWTGADVEWPGADVEWSGADVEWSGADVDDRTDTRAAIAAQCPECGAANAMSLAVPGSLAAKS